MRCSLVEKGKPMTDAEKLKLIYRLAVNLSPLTFTDEKVALGCGHALAVAIELITDVKEQDNES